jgi:integrase/recombinase XerD
MTTTASTAVVVYNAGPVDPEHVALAGFLGGYRGLTRDAYALDLRQFVAFCGRRNLKLFEARRSDIEAFGRELKANSRATATIARRRCTVTGFYRYAEEEGLISHSPAVHVRRPRIDYESHAIGLDRNEVGALLVAAGLGPAAEHALISLLALNGLRVSEAIGANIKALGLERGHRTLTIVRKGGKTVTIPLAPRTARAVDLAIGGRAAGPIFTASDGLRLDRHGAARIVRRVARRAGIAKPIGPHTPCATRSSPPPSTPASHYATSKRPPPMPTHARPCATTAPGSHWIVTPPSSSPPTSPAQRADQAFWAPGLPCWRPQPAAAEHAERRFCARDDQLHGRSRVRSSPCSAALWSQGSCRDPRSVPLDFSVSIASGMPEDSRL